ncbi:MAG: RdgB/HAM1 family non-canonical purine NTP pyrophosphatase, partial [Actinomycetota bacterium]
WATPPEDLPAVEESGESYLENALIKARAISEATAKPALADDSGIEVDALGGRPGIHSARFAGPEATDAQNNAKLLSMLEGVPPEGRTARYRCVAVLVFPDGREIAGVGACEGSIEFEPRGSGGFGYDPYFVPEGESQTMAELTPERKNEISHRGRALRGLADQLRRELGEA